MRFAHAFVFHVHHKRGIILHQQYIAAAAQPQHRAAVEFGPLHQRRQIGRIGQRREIAGAGAQTECVERG